VLKPLLPSDYQSFLGSIKEQVQRAQLQALVTVNTELILLYWHIGKEIADRQQRLGWGAAVTTQLSQDLHAAFPEMRGFSPRNLQYMRTFAGAYPDESQFAQQAVAQIPWGHHTVLLDKVTDPEQRLWYIHKTIEHGWSRNILTMQIESDLFHRSGKAITNFSSTLPALDSDLAQDALKDPYVFDFITTSDESKERDIQSALIAHIERFLLELGVGFSFVGSNYRLTIEGDDYYIDMLFYHMRLKCFVVIELKAGVFKPEYAGKLSFYLTAVDELIKRPDDNPSIGIILCKGKKKTTAEYALKNIHSPVGVATYETTKSLPEALKDQLPDIKELEEQLESVRDESVQP
jgi:predicted nuclease of restriction endonuclease-like (RecB) superfamily